MESIKLRHFNKKLQDLLKILEFLLYINMSIFDKEMEIPIDIVSLKSIGFKLWYINKNNTYIKHIHTRVNGMAYKIYEAKILAYQDSSFTWNFEVRYEFEYNESISYELTNIYDVEVLIGNVKQHIIKKVNSMSRKFPVEVTF